MDSLFSAYIRILQRVLREKRFLTVVGALCGAIGLLIFTFEPFAFILERIFYIDVQRTAMVLLLISTVALTLIYLQSGGARSAPDPTDFLQHLEKQIAFSFSKFSSLEKKIEENRIAFDTLRPQLELSAEERRATLDEISTKSSESAIKSIFEEQTKHLHDDLKKSLSLERLATTSAQISERLRREITDLRLRSNVNLLIGMSITAGGLYLLWSTVEMVDASQLLKELASEGEGSNAKFLKNLFLPLVPRILLVVFVEVFAYFFLRLYKNGLSEIKYFQNELTNIQSKLIAVEFSISSQNQDSLKASLEALSKTERNFILEKNQTTVELERAKSESDLTRNIIKTVPEMFKRSREK